MSDENKTRSREIIETALRLFAKNGFDAVSVRDICAELSLNCSVISYYFGGKKGLYLEILRGQFAARGRMMADLAARNLPPGEALLALIDLARETRRQNPHFAALIHREAHNPSPEFAQAAGEYEKAFGDQVADIVRNGQRQGVFRNVKPLALVPTVKMLLNGPDLETALANDYFEMLKVLLLEGLMADPAEDNRGIGKQSAKPRR